MGKKKQKTLAILLPTYNEEESIENMIKKIRALNLKDYEIVVVDSNSKDRTQSIAKRLGAKVIVAKRGKGRALKKAFKLLNNKSLLIVDCDESYPIEKVKEMLKKNADYIIAERVEYKQGSISAIKKIGNKLLTFIFNLLYSTSFRDVLSGMYLFNNRSYKKLSIEANGFDVEVDILSKVIKKGLSVDKIEISYLPRKGKSKISIFHGFPILFRMIKNRLL